MRYLYIILFLAVCYFPIFLKLDTHPIRKWDESRNAASAVEMMNETHNPFVRYYYGVPDTWETKPPLLMWLMIPFMKILGINELAIRLPSALATLGLCFLFILFFKNRFFESNKGILAGVFAAFALISSRGFIIEHVSRTGDHDAVLCLLLFGSAIAFYNWLENNHLRSFWTFIFCTIAAVLTKSIIGVLYLPALFMYIIFTKKLFFVLQKRELWLGIGVFLGIIGGYYGICEMLNAGHLANVWKMELLPRYAGKLEGTHTLADKWYFVKKIIEKDFSAIVIPPLSIAYFFIKNEGKKRRFVSLMWLIIIISLLVVSNGAAFDWYDAPVYAPLAAITGLVLSDIFEKIWTFFEGKKSQYYIGVCAFLILITACFSRDYYKIVEKNHTTSFEDDPSAKYPEYLTHLARIHPEWREHLVLWRHYDAQIIFYMAKMRQKGIKIKKITDGVPELNELPIGTRFLSCEAFPIEKLAAIYVLRELNSYEECRTLEVVARR